MRTGFLANISFVVGINLLIKPLYIFGIERVVQNEVGVEAYGLFFALFNVVYLLQITNDFGIQNFNHTLFSQHNKILSKYLPKVLGTKMFLALIFIICTLAGGFILGYREEIFPLLFFIILNQILASFILLLRTNLSAMGFYYHDSAMSVIDKALLILALGYWLHFSDLSFTVYDFVYCQTASFAIALAITLTLVARKIGWPKRSLKFERAFLRWQLGKSYPYALVILLMMLYTRMDGVMIERLLMDGREQAGIYAASYRILDASNMIGFLFAGLLLPMFAKILHNHDEIKSLLKRAISLLLTASLTLAVGAVFWAQEIIEALYLEANEYWASIFQVLMVSYVAIGMTSIFSTYLTASQRILDMNLIFLFGVIVNFTLNLLLIQIFKAWGAAIATLITQFFTAFALIFLVLSRLKWRPSYSFLGKRCLFALLLFACIGLLSQTSLDWRLQGMIYLLFAGLTSVITGQVNIKEIRATLDR